MRCESVNACRRQPCSQVPLTLTQTNWPWTCLRACGLALLFFVCLWVDAADLIGAAHQDLICENSKQSPTRGCHGQCDQRFDSRPAANCQCQPFLATLRLTCADFIGTDTSRADWNKARRILQESCTEDGSLRFGVLLPTSCCDQNDCNWITGRQNHFRKKLVRWQENGLALHARCGFPCLVL